MTIADNIDFLNDAKKLFEDIANNPKINETIKTYFIIESLENAIDIMRKYQMIEQIAFPLQFCSTDKLEHEAIMKICEVIEDGKID